ncbi:MAG: cofactor-independent phosphoglycerate mutase [Candidatus Magnetoovum sp. WYHC-5]|nr:cofactor-independent phosphoglycerate mutase [Candidatus Magnetoovum sp. WYHC-5]
MKYIVLVGDGMADEPLEVLGGLTPLQKADTPNMDRLSSEGVVGIAATVPLGFPPGSDVANLSILGYDPRRYYTGRAPLEAASMGIDIGDNDVAYRCNLVCLDSHKERNETLNKTLYEDLYMQDYSAGHISTEEARQLIEHLGTLHEQPHRFYAGISYRHLMLWTDGKVDIKCTPPHDITGKAIAEFLPQGEGAEVLLKLMKDSYEILGLHEINEKRLSSGKRPANSIWLWGQGKKPLMPSFKDIYGLKGALISAVDLTKGLGVCAGLQIIEVPGITGYIDTNYEGKAEYGFAALKEADFVYIHVEAPDEAGHMGNVEAKVQAIEDFDKRVVGRMLELLRGERFRVLIMPDHATPIKIKTHSNTPVPFILYDSTAVIKGKKCTYDESIKDREDTVFIDDAYKLMGILLGVKQLPQ